MDAARRAWIKKHLNSGMVPVNTIRDWMSSAQFLGGQALLVAVGVSGYAVTTAGSLHGVIVLRLDGRLILFVKLLALVLLQAFNYYLLLTTYYLLLTACTRALAGVQLLLTTYYLLLTAALVLLQAFNFVRFIQCVRYYGHTSFLINAGDVDGQPITEALVWDFMKRASRAYGSGFRGLLCTWPLLLWVFGPVWLFLGTIALVASLRRLDYGEFERSLFDEEAGVVSQLPVTGAARTSELEGVSLCDARELGSAVSVAVAG